MKYWASNYAIIPAERNPCLADVGMLPKNEWLSPGITSWMRCGEHSRGLFLQLLLSSMFLIAGPSTAQASGVVYKRMCALEHMSGPSVDVQTPGSAPASAMYGVIPGTSNIKHQTSNAGHQTITANTGIHSPAPCPNPRSESPQSFLHSIPVLVPRPGKIPSFLSPNGALLAHQTTSIANPSPTARNGVAARTPLPEAGERGYKMNHHFQICTRGYLAWPGIPVPASGLFIGHVGGNHRVNVERWKGVKDGQPPPFTHSHLYTFTHSSLNPEEP